MSELPNINDYICRALERSKLVREKFHEQKVPKSSSNIVIIPFFGDHRSEFILSTMILNRYRETNRHLYLVVCSWPGHSGLYPYVDEYWTIKDESILESLALGWNGFSNARANNIERVLVRCFENVLPPDDAIFTSWYSNGLTQKYLQKFGKVLYSLPSIPSINLKFNSSFADRSGPTIFVYPSLKGSGWRHHSQEASSISEDFWFNTIDALVERGYRPIVYQNYGTHDVSTLGNKCTYVSEENVLTILGLMRSCDCTLDVFSGISSLAIVARAPFVSCDERSRFVGMSENEIRDLCCRTIPKKYFFSFVPMTEGHSRSILIKSIVNKLDEFIPTINKDALPSTIESNVELDYKLVRQKQLKRLGATFFSYQKGNENES